MRKWMKWKWLYLKAVKWAWLYTLVFLFIWILFDYIKTGNFNSLAFILLMSQTLLERV